MRCCIALVLVCLITLPAWADTTSTPAPAATTAVSAATAPVAVPEPTPQAVSYYETGNMLWVVDVLWGFLVPAVILFSGFSARLGDWAKQLGKYWYFTLVIYLVLFTLLTFLVDLPLNYYEGFLRPHAYGLSSQALGKWISDTATGLIISLVLGALLIWIPYLLLRRATKRWWFYTWLASIPVLVLLLFVEPIWIEPLFNKFGPMQDHVLETKILALAHRAGIDDARVFEVNKSVDTNELNAYVTGIGNTKRIVLWDTIIKRLDANELLVVMGHEMGHYVLGHVWKTLILGCLFLLAGLWLIHRSAGWILRRYGPRFGFTELGDVASLPLLILIFSLFSFLLQPLPLAYSRHNEHEADRFGLEITHDNHACATAFVKLTEHDLGYPRPGLLYTLWRSSHPSLGDRIDFCNDYHPWTTGQPEKYAAYFKPER